MPEIFGKKRLSKGCIICNQDDLVKSRKIPFFVIPAKAGIQFIQIVKKALDSCFHRSDDFLRSHQKLYANIFPVPYFFLKWAGMMCCNRGVCEGHGKDCCYHIIVKGLNEIIGDSLGLTNNATS